MELRPQEVKGLNKVGKAYTETWRQQGLRIQAPDFQIWGF